MGDEGCQSSESEMSKWSTTKKLANKFSTRKRASKAPETAPLFLDQDDDTIQKRLHSLILSSRQKWTYAIFWRLSFFHKIPPFLVLRWGDGYFQGEDKPSKPRKTSPVEQAHRKRVLRDFLVLIGQPDEEIEEDVTDSEWFFLVSLAESFVVGLGNGIPGRALHNSTAVWVTGADRLASFGCERANMAAGFGIQTMVYIPLVDGVIELGSSSLIFPYAEFDLLDRITPLFKFKNNIRVLEVCTDLARPGSISWPVQPGYESESSVGNQPMFKQGNLTSQRNKEDCNCSDSESDDRYIEVFTQILRRGRDQRLHIPSS